MSTHQLVKIERYIAGNLLDKYRWECSCEWRHDNYSSPEQALRYWGVHCMLEEYRTPQPASKPVNFAYPVEWIGDNRTSVTDSTSRVCSNCSGVLTVNLPMPLSMVDDILNKHVQACKRGGV